LDTKESDEKLIFPLQHIQEKRQVMKHFLFKNLNRKVKFLYLEMPIF
jgi:hypothetical protein